MKKYKLEFAVGLFVIIGILALIYLSVKVTHYEFGRQGGYQLKAVFDNAGGLKKGASVEVAGVPVGIIKNITLKDYRAFVVFNVSNGVNVPDDSMASVKTKGLLGEKFMEISPGASDNYLSSGGEIIDTQSPIDFERALGKYIFGNVKK